MENIFKKIENELDTLPIAEKVEILKKLRGQVDEIDGRMVELLSERTLRSVMIGKIKKSLGLPTYNPEREKEISSRISKFANEPLTQAALIRIYERIIDESRAVQKLDANKFNFLNSLKVNSKISFSNLLTKKQWIIVAVFFVCTVLLLTYILFSPNYYEARGPLRFEIKEGEPLTEIVDHLYEKKIISSKFNMKLATFLSGREKDLRAARFYIPNGLSYLDLIDLFVNGKADFMREVKIRDGLTIKWMAFIIKREVFVDSTAFVNIARDSAFINSLGLKYKTLQGYLMPGEYGIYERSSAREVIEKMYNSTIEFFTDSLKERSKELGYSLHQIITLASIIKGETNRISEMPTIAQVYYNRLKIGMRLQADPTVQYIQPNGWKNLTFKDLKMDSPYNTYIYSGLPPGPINNPGRNALMAALYPDSSKYLYFVAGGDGRHNFSNNYSQHLREVAKLRRYLKSQKRK